MLVSREDFEEIERVGKEILERLLKERPYEAERLGSMLQCEKKEVFIKLVEVMMTSLKKDLNEKKYELRTTGRGAFELYWRSAVELAAFDDTTLKRLCRSYSDQTIETSVEAIQLVLPHFAQISKPVEVQKEAQSLSTKYERWNKFKDEDENLPNLDGRYCARHKVSFNGENECPKCLSARKEVPEINLDRIQAMTAAASAIAADPTFFKAERLSLHDALVIEARRAERQSSLPDLKTARIALEKRLATDRKQSDVVHALSNHIENMPDDDVSLHSCLSAMQKATRHMPEEYADIFKEALTLK